MGYNRARAEVTESGKHLDDAVVRLALRDLDAGLQELYGLRAPAVVAYGSYARGEATRESDVDLLLLYDYRVNPSREISQLISLLANLNLRYGLLISVLPISERDYREAEGPFWRNVRREGVAIHAR